MRGGIGDALRKWQPANPEAFAEKLANGVKNTARTAGALAGGPISSALPKLARGALKVATGPVVGILTDITDANAEDDVQKIKDWKPKK